MITPLILAQLCSDLYDATPGIFDDVWTISGKVIAHKKMGGVDVVIPRGTHNLLDAIRDIEALPIHDPNIGWIHGGMNIGMVDATTQIMMACNSRIVFGGHSLGGGECRNLAARFAHAGSPALQCTVFEAPRSLMNEGCQILRDSKTWLSSFRNMADMITEVPTIDPRWNHPDLYAHLAQDALPGDRDLFFRYHHISLIIAGLKTLYPEDIPEWAAFQVSKFLVPVVEAV